MAESTARVARSLPGTAITAATAISSSLVTAAIAAGTLGAVPSNVAALTALVALLSATNGASRRAAVLGAFAADVAGLTAAVAALLGLRCGALTAQVALVAAVVAGGVALAGAVGSTVSRVTAYICQSKFESRPTHPER